MIENPNQNGLSPKEHLLGKVDGMIYGFEHHWDPASLPLGSVFQAGFLLRLQIVMSGCQQLQSNNLQVQGQ